MISPTLWSTLHSHFDRDLGRAMRSGRRKIEADALVRAMVFNRLCDPTSKLGCLRWLDTVAMPEMPAKIEHHHLLRAMDALMDNVDRVEAELAKQIRPLVDRDLTVVFYDLATVRIHGEGKVEDDIRSFGMNKETGGIARQFVLGVVQTAEGLPLMHTVHPGNVAETKTLLAMLQTVLARFPIQRVILVADRGLLSLENIGELWPGSGVQGVAPEPGDGEPSPAGRQPAVGATPQTGAAGRDAGRCARPAHPHPAGGQPLPWRRLSQGLGAAAPCRRAHQPAPSVAGDARTWPPGPSAARIPARAARS